MTLYLHNIWIHWPLAFISNNFQQEGTDPEEAWLATLKRTAKYNTNRKQDDALIEIIMRYFMEDEIQLDIKGSNKSSNKMNKIFEDFEWKEFFFSKEFIANAKEDVICLIQKLVSFGFSERKGNYKITNDGVYFKTLPLY
jgi:hypothetical protein